MEYELVIATFFSGENWNITELYISSQINILRKISSMVEKKKGTSSSDILVCESSTKRFTCHTLS